MSTKGEKRDSAFRKIWDLGGTAIMINLLFLLCCIPVVTIGPALCGLFSAIRFMIRGDKWSAGFKEGFCSRLVRKMLVGTVFLAADIYVLFSFITTVFYMQEGQLVSTIILGLITLLTLMISAALIPTEVFIPTGVIQWLRNGVSLAFAAPLPILLTVVLFWLPPLLVFFRFEYALAVAVVFLAVYFPLVGFASILFLKNPLIKLKKANEEAEESEG